MFCAFRLIFGGSEGVGSRFHFLFPRTSFRQVPFSCFALSDMFSFGVESVGSRFHVIHSRTHFRRFRVRRVPYSCFALIAHVFGGTEGVRSRLHVLCSQTRLLPFSCFALPDTFSLVQSSSGPVFMFCTLELVFSGSESVASCFHVMHSRTHFRRYRWRHAPFSYFALPYTFSGCRWCRVPFTCFALPDSFSAVRRASGPVFMFCVPVLVFGGSMGVGSRFHILRPRTRFRR
jgi:hypothetical protein